MLSPVRALLIGAAALTLLAACGMSSYGTQSGISATGSTTTGTPGTGGAVGGLPGGGENPVPGTHDTVMMTSPTSAQVVSAVVGSKITVPVTFNSSDGKTITAFALSLGASLPAGWTVPASGFACPMVSTGSGCVLNLTYQPTAYTTPQTITLDYVFTDNAGENVTIATSNFQYQATTNDNVIATPAPAGQINATIGQAAQTVTVTYATDDGHPAANLSVTSPMTLPAGWSGPSPSTCATVSAGTACTMTYSYQPMAPGNGTLMVDFAYDNDSASAKTGSFSIPYRAIDHNLIVATPSMNPVTTLSGTPTQVTLIFTTSDTYPVSSFAITSNLASLNTYWSSAASNLSCAQVSTGNGCSLTLTYSPAAADSGTQQITYSYTDNAGSPQTGSVNIPYSAT